MKISYQPLCQGATAIPADAVLKDYGNVKEVCSECGVPVSDTEYTGGVKTAEQIVDGALSWFTAGTQECAARKIIRYSDAVPVIEAAKLEAKAQLESLMQDYAIEARIEKLQELITIQFAHFDTQCHSEFSTDDEMGEIKRTLTWLKEELGVLEQLRTTDQTLKGE